MQRGPGRCRPQLDRAFLLRVSVGSASRYQPGPGLLPGHACHPGSWPCPSSSAPIEVIESPSLPHQGGGAARPPPTGSLDALLIPGAAGRRVRWALCRFMVTRTEMQGIPGLVSATAGAASPLTRASLEPPHCATRVDLLAAGQQLVVFRGGQDRARTDRIRLHQGRARLAVLAAPARCGGSGCACGAWLQPGSDPKRAQPCGLCFWLRAPLSMARGDQR